MASLGQIMKAAIVLSATDKATRVINKVFGNVDAKLARAQKQAIKVSKTAADIGKKSAIVGAAIAAPLVFATQKAIAFEDSMADVAKVLNLQQGSRELAEMAANTQALGIHLAKTPDDAAALVASLAQGGTLKKDLFDVGKFAGEMSVAFDIMAGVAGDRFTKMKNALGITTEATKLVADSVNFLSDNAAVKASQLLDFLSAGGAGAARMLKISGQDIAAIGTTFIEMGKSGSEAATIVSRMTKGLQKNSKAAKIFRKEGGGLKGIFAALEAGNQLSGQDRFKFFNAFGQYGQDIALAASNMERLKRNAALVADVSKFQGSVTGEFGNRSQTRAFQLARAKSQFESLAVTAGNTLLPVITQILQAVTPLMQRLSDWMQANPKLTAQIVKGAAAMAAISFGISGVSFGVSGLAKGFAMLSGSLRVVTTLGRIFTAGLAKPGLMIKLLTGKLGGLLKAFRFIKIAIMAVGRALFMNPIGLIIAGIATAAFLIWKHWEPIKTFFVKLWKVARMAFADAWAWIKGLGTKFYDAGRNIIKSIWDGMKALANKPVEAIRGIMQKVRAYLPFSPAKIGPLRDIHRIRLVETIAGNIKAAPAVQAMKRVTNRIAGVGPGLQLSGAGGGGFSVNYSPTINMNGPFNDGAKNELMNILAGHKDEIMRMIKDLTESENRIKF